MNDQKPDIADNEIVKKHRPKAPGDLSVFCKNLWNKTINDMPSNWFSGELLVLLRSYCLSAERLHSMESELEETEFNYANESDLNAYKSLQRIISVEITNVTRLADKLRITKQAQQARTNKNPTKTIVSKKPWQWDENDD